jgi:hypothetical protein
MKNTDPDSEQKTKANVAIGALRVEIERLENEIATTKSALSKIRATPDNCDRIHMVWNDLAVVWSELENAVAHRQAEIAALERCSAGEVPCGVDQGLAQEIRDLDIQLEPLLARRAELQQRQSDAIKVETLISRHTSGA